MKNDLTTQHGQFFYNEDVECYEKSIPTPLFTGNSLSMRFPSQIGKFDESDFESCFKINDEKEGYLSEVIIGITCYEDDEIIDSQKNALSFILSNKKDIENTVINKIKDIKNPYENDLIETLADSKQVELMKKFFQQMDSIENLSNTFVLGSIDIVRESENEMGSYALNFRCSWDKEHGFAILMNKLKILETGGSSEFYDY